MIFNPLELNTLDSYPGLLLAEVPPAVSELLSDACT